LPVFESHGPGTEEESMRRSISLLAAMIWAAAALAQAAATRGHLVLIGGGEKPADAMRKFVELAGGPQALIVAIPTASKEPDTGAYYVTLFKETYGCANVVALEIKNKADAMRTDYAELARKAGGVFFGGGDQIRITNALLDTPVGAAIAEAFNRGAVIGGTSAGTACQSDPMITGEGDFKVIRANSVELWRGLGFFRGVVVDQHFIARQRSNRLLSVILEHPELLGVGVDEDTAVWVRPDDTFQVMGRSCVMVLDAKGAQVTRQPVDTGLDLLGVHGLTVQVLLPGETYDLARRAVIPGGAVPTPGS
jgi:cyanophycinase